MQTSTLAKPSETGSLPGTPAQLRQLAARTPEHERRLARRPSLLPDGSDSRAWSLAAFVSTMALFFILTIFCWGLNKGFDPNLEGFYMLSYQHPDLYPTFSSFHLLLSKLPKLTTSDILQYRFLESFCRIVPPAVLSASFFLWAKKWLRIDQGQLVFALIFACLGGTMCFTSCPRTVSYNGLSAALAFLAAAGVFAGITEAKSSQTKLIRAGLILASGALVGLAFFVKCTTACCMIPLLLAFIVFGSGDSKLPTAAGGTSRSWLWQCPLLLAGALASVAWYFTCMQTPPEWWHAFGDAMRTESQTSHSSSTILNQLMDLLLRHARNGVPFLVGCIVANYFIARGGKFARRATWMLTAAVIGALFALARHQYFLGKEAYVPLMALGISACLVPWRPFKSELFRGALLLFLLPLAATIGTNCEVLGFIASNLSPFFVLMSVALLVGSRTTRAPYAVALGSIAFVVFCGVEFFQGYMTYRYDSGPLPEQTAQVTDVAPLKGIDVDPEQAKFFLDSKKILQANGFVPGDMLVGLYDLPGLNYALDAKSPGQAFYVSWPERDSLNAFYLDTVNLSAVPRLFVALNSIEPEAEVVGPLVKDVFRKQGIPFPESFELIGRLPGPVGANKVTLYKRRDGRAISEASF